MRQVLEVAGENFERDRAIVTARLEQRNVPREIDDADTQGQMQVQVSTFVIVEVNVL